ncbi:MAG: DUF120 domain-containing protein [Candidatus Thermoplasmatota archaeon]|nr:DUF120 domain-containing protein [Candidatus Thermoplasmatota archaeon]
MTYEPARLLMGLAKKGGLEKYIDITTGDLSKDLGCSQQTASIYLVRLTSEGYIDRIMKSSGSRLRMTEKGLDLLMRMYADLHSMFGKERMIKIKGQVASGLGEGAYYLSQKGYIDQIKEKLGFDPYPGTFNVLLSQQDSPVIELLRRGAGIDIGSFTNGDRTFGGCICYKCLIEGHPGAVMIPARTIHKNTLEIISDVRLRSLIEEGNAGVEIDIDYPSSL